MVRRWRPGVIALAVVLVGALGLVSVVLHRGSGSSDGNEVQRGALTPKEYATALRWARSELAQDHAQLSQAVATVGPTPRSRCTSKDVVHVSLVGTFPRMVLGGPGSHGPDTWMTIAVNPVTDDVCAYGPSTGRFRTPPGSANLLPAL